MVIAVPKRSDERVADVRIAPNEPFVARHRPAQQQRLPGPRDVAGDPLADLLAVPTRFIRQTDRAAHGEDAVVDEHDRHAIGAEHARETGRRPLEERLGVALRSHELLQLARRFGACLELGGRTLDPPEGVLLDELERDEGREPAEVQRLLVAERAADPQCGERADAMLAPLHDDRAHRLGHLSIDQRHAHGTVGGRAGERGREERRLRWAAPGRLRADVVRGIGHERLIARPQDDRERVGMRELGEHRDARGPELAFALDRHQDPSIGGRMADMPLAPVIEPHSRVRGYPTIGGVQQDCDGPSRG